jgi:hypothetical protein
MGFDRFDYNSNLNFLISFSNSLSEFWLFILEKGANLRLDLINLKCKEGLYNSTQYDDCPSGT